MFVIILRIIPTRSYLCQDKLTGETYHCSVTGPGELSVEELTDEINGLDQRFHYIYLEDDIEFYMESEE